MTRHDAARQPASGNKPTATVTRASAVPTRGPAADTTPDRRPILRHIARTATSATPPRFSIARADTIDRSADNIT